MKTIVGRIGGTALIGTVMLTALAALPASATVAVSQPSTEGPAITSTQPAPSAPSQYTVVATGSIAIQGSKTSARDNAISAGMFTTNTAGAWSGFVSNANGDQLAANTVGISPSSLIGSFYLIPKSGGALDGGGQLQGHQNADGDLVYSGTLYFYSYDYTYHQNVTVTNLTLHPADW
jgi:hypothetical protein